MKWQVLGRDVLDFIFPPLCFNCGQRLYAPERDLCLSCWSELPRTDFEKFRENPVYRSFVGRFPLENAASWLHFQKGGLVQDLMHAFKYRNRPDLARQLGKTLAQEWREAPILSAPDLIVPVPLHPRKRRKRGYNQAEAIARGIAEVLNKPLVLDALERRVHKNSQTREQRFNRWEQVKAVFALSRPEALQDQHVLLVDDVITTGATLEACLQVMQEAKGSRFSVLSLARA
jgi:ComF family protein